jgi:hypothetical protein
VNDYFEIVLAASACSGTVAALTCLSLMARRRLLTEAPTSKVLGIFIGMTEVKGTAECAAPLTSHLAETACVQYKWLVEEHWSRTRTETYTDSKGNSHTRIVHESGWSAVDSGEKAVRFYLKDETGAVLVDPTAAKLEPQVLFSETASLGDPLYYGKGPQRRIADSDDRRRFTESGIPLHASLFIVGRATERTDVVAPIIEADSEAELFLISTRTEEAVTTSLTRWAIACGVLALLLGAVPLALFFWPPRDVLPALAPALAMLGYVIAVWLAGWLYQAFNGLVALRERVLRARALIEVQLKRRHDLIPGLVTVLSTLASHERGVQEALAALRSQLNVTAPGNAGPDPAGLAGTVRVVAEQYPAITAHEGFLKLQSMLIETEQRIALARGYYNDIAMHLAIRVGTVPDGWLAALMGITRPAYFEAESFERAPVRVI